MRGRRKNYAVFVAETGETIELDFWSEVIVVATDEVIPAYRAKPDECVRLIEMKEVLALRDERNYDRTSRRGVE